MYQAVSPPDIAHPVGGGGGDIPLEYHNGITTSSGGAGSGCTITDIQETKPGLRHKSLPKNPTLDHPHYHHHQTPLNQHDSPVPLKGSNTSTINEYIKTATATTTTTTGGRNHHHVSPSRNSSSNSGDVLLQWGQRKRSRCVRALDHKNSSLISSPSPPPAHTHCNSMPPPPVPVAPPSSSLHISRVVPGKDGSISGSLPSKTTRSTVGRRSVASSSPFAAAAATASASDNHDHGRKISSFVRPGPTTTTPPKNERLCQFGNNGKDPAGVSSENNGVGGERTECPRIYISLSRKEKEDDFYAMKGTKLPHRPKKRSKPVERSLQYVFPGLWLSDLTRSKYEVRERKCVKKQQKRRGLKGLESMDSESD